MKQQNILLLLALLAACAALTATAHRLQLTEHEVRSLFPNLKSNDRLTHRCCNVSVVEPKHRRRRTLFKMRHDFDGYPVWGSHAIIVEEGKARRLRAIQQPRSLEDFVLKEHGVVSKSQSLASCIKLWRSKTHSKQPLLEASSTDRYLYFDKSESRLVFADQIELRGTLSDTGHPFRFNCLFDASSNKTLYAWTGVVHAFGPGGNVRTGEYIYNGVAKPLLPAVPVTGSKGLCRASTSDNSVAVHDMAFRTNRLSISSAPVPTFNCSSGYVDQINEGFGPIDDCLQHAKKATDMLFDNNWGALGDMTQVVPTGSTLHVCAHYGGGLDAAFWDGTCLYVGDGKINFFPLCTCDDVIGHEIGHAVTQIRSGLIYTGESACVSEGFSDSFGEAVEAYYRGSADFLVANRCSKKAPFYVRDMTQPMSYLTYRSGMDPHVCSGIFNHAFYRLANSPGWSIRQAFIAFFNANSIYWVQDVSMKQAACDVLSAVQDAFIGPSKEVIAAFKAVDIDLSTCPPSR